MKLAHGITWKEILYEGLQSLPLYNYLTLQEGSSGKPGNKLGPRMPDKRINCEDKDGDSAAENKNQHLGTMM